MSHGEIEKKKYKAFEISNFDIHWFFLNIPLFVDSKILVLLR